MKTIRYVAWALVALLVVVVGYVAMTGDAGRKALEMANVKLGGPFELIRADGTPITDKDLSGKPHAIFFGFTHCPEVCPTTLYEAAGWLEKLGPDAENFNIYFITVDPERDTPEVIKDYVASFDPRITGITGAPDKIAKVISDYRVYAKRVELEGGDYTMDHTATVYLINADGSFAGTIAYNENPDIALEKLRKLIKNG
ncbi:MAG TPA: SCO family protein [Rhizobiaceae bacterium]|nr:SCO family protein [Rhizobiaceae bacterium]